MIESVDLGKRAEAYANFASWCINHKMPAWTIVECIELCIRATRKSGYSRHWKYRDQVRERLKAVGATEIEFIGDWPNFESPAGEKTCLPLSEFI